MEIYSIFYFEIFIYRQELASPLFDLTVVPITSSKNFCSVLVGSSFFTLFSFGAAIGIN